MIEDMKGKIRVYCRARPMSKSELDRVSNSRIPSTSTNMCDFWVERVKCVLELCLFCCQGNFSVLQSPDEYSINVESSRGTKEFNFDRIFMPEHSQEQVFEDTYVRILSYPPPPPIHSQPLL